MGLAAIATPATVEADGCWALKLIFDVEAAVTAKLDELPLPAEVVSVAVSVHVAQAAWNTRPGKVTWPAPLVVPVMVPPVIEEGDEVRFTVSPTRGLP